MITTNTTMSLPTEKEPGEISSLPSEPDMNTTSSVLSTAPMKEESPNREPIFAPSLLPQAEATDNIPPHAVSPSTEKLTVILDTQGNFTPGWWENHESLKDLGKTLKKFKSPEALARSYSELEKIRSYSETQDEEKMKRMRCFLGLPEKKEDYKITAGTPQEEKESFWDEHLASRMAETAYEYAIPPRAMQALTDTFIKEQQEHMHEAAETRLRYEQETKEKTLSELKDLWGPQCQSKINAAAGTLTRLCGECGLDPSNLGNDPVLGSHPEFIRLLNHISTLIGEPSLKGAQQEGASRSHDDMKRMEKDPAHPLHEAYMNYNHPNHEYANHLYDKIMLSSEN